MPLLERACCAHCPAHCHFLLLPLSHVGPLLLLPLPAQGSTSLLHCTPPACAGYGTPLGVIARPIFLLLHARQAACTRCGTPQGVIARPIHCHSGGLAAQSALAAVAFIRPKSAFLPDLVLACQKHSVSVCTTFLAVIARFLLFTVLKRRCLGAYPFNRSSNYRCHRKVPVAPLLPGQHRAGTVGTDRGRTGSFGGRKGAALGRKWSWPGTAS